MPRIIVCKECGEEKVHKAKERCIVCYGRFRYKNNKEHFRDLVHRYRIKNRDKIREQRKGYRITHKEQKKVSDHEYYLKNRNKIIQRSNGWRKNNPKKSKEYNQKHRDKCKEFKICYDCGMNVGFSDSINYCQKCHEYRLIKSKEKRKKQSINGKCQSCGEDLDNFHTSATYCMRCRDIKLKRDNNRKIKREKNKLCRNCRNLLDCESEYYCYSCLLKQRESRIRSRQGLNPYFLSENVKMNNNKLGIEIIGEA